MSTDTLETYRPSGNFTATGLFYPVGAAAVLGFPLGLAYAYLIRWIPIAYLSVLITIGYGFGFGWGATRLLKAGKVRNPALAFGSGLLTGLLAEYWNWNGHIHVLYAQAPYLLRPGQIVRAMAYLYQHGSWTIGSSSGSDGDPVTGVFLALVWIAEGLVIVGFPALMLYNFVKDTPFCERSGTWLDQKKDIDALDAIEQPEQVALLKQGSFQPIIDAKPRPAGSPVFTRLTLKRSPASDSFCTVRVQRVLLRKDKKGKVQLTVTHLTGDLILPAAMFELVAQFENPPPAGTAPA